MNLKEILALAMCVGAAQASGAACAATGAVVIDGLIGMASKAFEQAVQEAYGGDSPHDEPTNFTKPPKGN